MAITAKHESLAELRAALRAMPSTAGEDVRDQTWALYAPLQPAEPQHRIVRDLAYGPHPRHRVDLHLPTETSGAARPVFLYVHGGGFVGGDKQIPGLPFYDNMGGFAVDAGFLGATMTYRLAPEATYPSGAEDVAAAVDYLLAHVAEYGGRPDAIVVMGHSAGASHVASYVADPVLRASAGASLRGAVLSSGPYDPGATPNPGSNPYYGPDGAKYSSYSSIPGLASSGVALLVSMAELDPPALHRSAADLALAVLDATGTFPGILQMPGHNHFSATAHIGTDDTWAAQRIADFVSTVTA